jgi:hypothetical protein
MAALGFAPAALARIEAAFEAPAAAGGGPISMRPFVYAHYRLSVQRTGVRGSDFAAHGLSFEEAGRAPEAAAAAEFCHLPPAIAAAAAAPCGLEERAGARPAGGVTHTASSKYHDGNISLGFIHTKHGEPLVIMDFRLAIQKVLCLSPPRPAARTIFVGGAQIFCMDNH